MTNKLCIFHRYERYKGIEGGAGLLFEGLASVHDSCGNDDFFCDFFFSIQQDFLCFLCAFRGESMPEGMHVSAQNFSVVDLFSEGVVREFRFQ